MNFREFVKLLEAGGLWSQQEPPYPGFQPLKNCDPYNGGKCGSATAPAPRMKKMKKK